MRLHDQDMTPRILSLPLLASAVVAIFALTGVSPSAYASPARLDATSVGLTGAQTGGHLTITGITEAQYEGSVEYGEGHCANQDGITICDRVTFDNTSLGEAHWTAVAAVGHADDVYVEEDVKTMENNVLDSTGHASGLGPWIEISWVGPRHIGDPNGILIPGEAKLQFLTVLSVPGGTSGAASYCSGPESQMEYSLSCGTGVPSDW